MARWIAWQNMLLSPNIKPVNKPRTPTAFCRFPWEEAEDEELKRKAKEYRVTPEEIAELNRIFAEVEAAQKQNNGGCQR